MGMLTKHLLEAPRRPASASAAADIPADVEAIVLKALDKDRDSASRR